VLLCSIIGFIIILLAFAAFLFSLKPFRGRSSQICGTWTKRISDGSQMAVCSLCFKPSGTLVISVAGSDELAKYSVAGGRLSLRNADDDFAAFSVQFPSDDEMVFGDPEEDASPLFAGTWHREGTSTYERESGETMGKERKAAREMAEAEKARARAEYCARESAIAEANRRQREALEAEEERRIQRERDRQLMTPWIKARRH
jgi:hypothetical protein